MFISYYSSTCFPDKNKLYYKIFKRDVNTFLRPFREFRREMDNKGVSYKITLLLEEYCKHRNPPINIKLRKKIQLNENDKKLIKVLDYLIRHFKCENDIIVYRGIDIDVFDNDLIYVEPGYLSTSLVKESIEFCHKKDYLYKILVSKGSFGFCPNEFTFRNIEYELILPRNTKLQLLCKKKRKEYTEIVCKSIK